MADIISRMAQWDSANNAKNKEELNSALGPVSAPSPIAKSSNSLVDRAKAYYHPMKKSKFDIESRVNAWNTAYDANDTKTYEALKKSDPFAEDEMASGIVGELQALPPETLLDMLDECVSELEKRDGGAAPETEAPAEQPEDTPKDEAPKESEKPEEPKDDEKDEKKDEKDEE